MKKCAFAKVCNIGCPHLMRVGYSEITFLSRETNQLIYTFPLTWIRRSCDNPKTFNLKVGRTCLNVKGILKFKLQNPKEVVAYLLNIMKHYYN